MPGSTIRPKVLLHSDCDFFAGCENMVAIFANSSMLTNSFDLSISFRESESYSQGFLSRSPNFGQRIPLKLRVPDLLQQFNVARETSLRRMMRFFFYVIQLLACSVQNLKVLVRLLIRLRPDIIHINNGGYPGALSCRLAVVAAKLSGVKIILFVSNNMAVGYDSPYRKLDWLIDKFVVRNVSFFLTGSIEASLKLGEVLKVPRIKLLAIPNATQIRVAVETPGETRTRLHISPKHLCVIGMVGVPLPRKGHMFLLESIFLASQNKEFLDLNPLFLIEGNLNSMLDLQEFVDKNSLRDLVRFIGREENVFDFYAILDYLVYPSNVHEDFPNVISEALSMGVPVISSRVAGAVEQIEDSVNGFLFNIGAKHELATIFFKVTRNPKFRQNLSEAAKVKYRLNYTPEIVVGKYARLYKRLLGGHD